MKKIFLLLVACCSMFLSVKGQWIGQNSGLNITLQSVCFLNKDTGFVAGGSGTMLKTIDGGANWSQLNTGIQQFLRSVHFPNKAVGYAVGMGDTIIKTIDGGATWTTKFSGSSFFLNAVRFVNADTGYVVGSSGTILKTTNGGTSWSTQASGTTEDLLSIYFTNTYTGYAVGSNGTILKTVNGGTNWVAKTGGGTNYLRSVCFTDSLTGYIAGSSGKLLKTTNGGTTWIQKASGTTVDLYSVCFADANRGYASGSNGKIIRTNNAGTNWISLSSGSDFPLFSVAFATIDTGYIVGFDGVILKTTNGGLSPVSIVKHPQSQARRVGNNVTFKSTATGTQPLSFQWKLNGTIVPGATDSVLNISNVSFSKEGYYTCEVTNMLNTVISDSAELMIADCAELPGDTILLTAINASGTIQWQVSSDTINWLNIVGATTNPFPYISTPTANGKRFYRAVITDPNCAGSTPFATKIIRNRVLTDISEVPVGAYFRGGFVFYVDGIGNGLIATPQDQSLSVSWGCEGMPIPSITPYNGAVNTLEIVSACLVQPIAASICDTLTFHGFDDWFLPAIDQLDYLYQQRELIGGFGINGVYWSSTDATENIAWGINYGVGWRGTYSKNSLNQIRAIRAFSLTDGTSHTNAEVISTQPIPALVKTQPIDTAVCAGSYAWFYVESNEISDPNITPTYTYQWKKNNVIIQGATSAYYAINSAYESHEGFYKCEVTNVCRTVSSDSVELKVVNLTINEGMGWITYGICGTQPAQLNNTINTNHPELGALSFTWSPDSALSNAHILNPVATPSVSTVYTLRATDPKGCTASSSSFVWVMEMTADAGTNKTIVCGNSAQLDAVTTNLGVAGTTYHWSPSTGLNSDTIANPVASPSITTKYTVIAQTPYGCSATDTVWVYVNPINVSLNNFQYISCGDSVRLDLMVNYGNTPNIPYLYQWSLSEGLDSVNVQKPYASPVSTTTYYVTVSTPSGCLATDSVRVNVNPISANLIPLMVIVCGDSNQLNLGLNNPTSGIDYSYQWSPSEGLDSANIQRPQASPITPTTYSVTVSTPAGCTTTISVQVNVIPFEITFTPQTFTCGESVHLVPAHNYGGSDTLSYLWTPSTGLSDTIHATTWADVSTNATYRLHITSADGCEAEGEQTIQLVAKDAVEICLVTVDSNNKNMVIWEKPLSPSIDHFNIFRETTITNQYDLIGTVPYDSLSVFVDTASMPDVKSNKYRISVADSCGLTAVQSTTHKSMHLAINQGMGNTWNLIWEPYEGFVPNSYDIYRGTHPDSMQYLGNTTGGSTQYTDLNPPAGYVYYKVGVVKPMSCNPTKEYSQSISNTASNNPNRIDSWMEMSMNITLYPNPTHDEVNVQIDNFNSPLTLEIIDITGRLVRAQALFSKLTKIQISDFGPGMYFYKISDHDKLIKLDKLIVE